MENYNEDFGLMLDTSAEDNIIDYTSYIDSVETTLSDIHSEIIKLDNHIVDMQSDLKVCGIGVLLVAVVLTIWGVFRW